MRISILSAAILLIICSGSGCDPSAPQSPSGADAGISPSASIRPHLLHDPPEAGALEAGLPQQDSERDASLKPSDAAPPPPKPLRANQALDEELPSTVEPSGVRLSARWLWSALPEPAQSPERSTEGIEAARALTALEQRFDISATGRMRVEFVGRGLPLPPKTELRARHERYGALLLWPAQKHYRPIVAGALRNLYGERRVDVSPLAKATVRDEGDGKRLGFETRKLRLSGGIGQLALELAEVPEARLGAALLCRMMVEMVGLHPSSQACRGDKTLPLAAQLFWKTDPKAKADISFEVTSVTRHAELSSAKLAFPPRRARFVPSGLPGAPGGVLLNKSHLQGLRSSGTNAPDPPEPGAPKEGMVASNQSDLLLYLLLDGIPVAYVRPWRELPVAGLRNGRYTVQWRTFLGEMVGPVAQRDLPAKIVYGSLDAGVPSKPDGG